MPKVMIFWVIGVQSLGAFLGSPAPYRAARAAPLGGAREYRHEWGGSVDQRNSTVAKPPAHDDSVTFDTLLTVRQTLSDRFPSR